MFPLNFNSLFRKSNGELTTLGKMFENSGGGSSYTLPTASASTKGGVKVGSGLTMDGETLNNDNPTPYTLPTANAETKGGVKVGSGLTMDGETLNNDNPTPYTLPTASTSTKGGVKIGSGLTMDGDILKNTNPTPYDDSEIVGDIAQINSDLINLIKHKDLTLTSTTYGHIVIPDTSSVNVINVFSKESDKVVIMRGFASSGDIIVELYSTEQLDVKANTSCNLRVIYS